MRQYIPVDTYFTLSEKSQHHIKFRLLVSAIFTLRSTFSKRAFKKSLVDSGLLHVKQL